MYCLLSSTFVMGLNFKIQFVMVVMIWRCLNLSDIAITAVKGVGYCCIINEIKKSESNHSLENSVLDDHFKTHFSETKF